PSSTSPGHSRRRTWWNGCASFWPSRAAEPMAGNSPNGRTLTASVARLVAVLAAATASLLVAILAWTETATGVAIAIAVGLVLLAFAVAGWLLVTRLAAPLDDLALDLAVIARDNPDHALRAG